MVRFSRMVMVVFAVSERATPANEAGAEDAGKSEMAIRGAIDPGLSEAART